MQTYQAKPQFESLIGLSDPAGRWIRLRCNLSDVDRTTPNGWDEGQGKWLDWAMTLYGELGVVAPCGHKCNYEC